VKTAPIIYKIKAFKDFPNTYQASSVKHLLLRNYCVLDAFLKLIYSISEVDDK